MFLRLVPDEHGSSATRLDPSMAHAQFASLPFTAPSHFAFNYPGGLVGRRLLSTKMPHSELVPVRTHTATQTAAGPRLHFLSKSVSVFTQGSVHRGEGGGGVHLFSVDLFCGLSPDKVLAHQASSFLGALNIQTGQ